MRIPKLTVRTRSQLRKWFENHHAEQSKLFLISWKKHTGKPFLTHRQQMEEAICWGWIDTTMKRIDDDRYGRYFVKRRPNGKWSTNTISYAEQLISEGRMQPAGMKAYKRGLELPIGDSAAGKKATMPKELEAALADNSKAQQNFEKYPPSTKRTFFNWIGSAKRPETVQKRVRKAIELAEMGRRPFTNDQ
jgi:uncharacterized protein YdeI (YjbR/CyaY-like superfamily)